MLGVSRRVVIKKGVMTVETHFADSSITCYNTLKHQKISAQYIDNIKVDCCKPSETVWQTYYFLRVPVGWDELNCVVLVFFVVSEYWSVVESPQGMYIKGLILLLIFYSYYFYVYSKQMGV